MGMSVLFPARLLIGTAGFIFTLMQNYQVTFYMQVQIIIFVFLHYYKAWYYQKPCLLNPLRRNTLNSYIDIRTSCINVPSLWYINWELKSNLFSSLFNLFFWVIQRIKIWKGKYKYFHSMNIKCTSVLM